MNVSQLLVDGFGRVAEEVDRVLHGLTAEHLTARVAPDANTIAWLVWHLTRVQDDHVADAFGTEQVWFGGWADRAGLPFPAGATGYGHTAAEVGQADVGAELLRGYHRQVRDRTCDLLSAVGAEDLDRVVDTRWDPPVTLGVRLVSVLADDLQHVGQAAYVRGLLRRG